MKSLKALGKDIVRSEKGLEKDSEKALGSRVSDSRVSKSLAASYDRLGQFRDHNLRLSEISDDA
jgi:hypothetical protein